MSLLHPNLGRKPLVSFSTTNRARLVGNSVGKTATEQPIDQTEGSKQMPPVTRKKSAAAAKKRRVGLNKVRFVKGRVQLRLPGYSGIKYLNPCHLVRYIPAARLRAAAKQVLKNTEHDNGKKKRRGKGKRGKNRSTRKQKSKKRRKQRQ
jgi:hypothetical protein